MRPYDIFTLARELSRPVACGLLPIGHADATLLVCAIRQEAPGFDPISQARTAACLMRQRAKEICVQREVAAYRIVRAVKPLIATREPKNVLLRTAHDINGRNGFPLRETEVEPVVKREVAWSNLSERRRHGR